MPLNSDYWRVKIDLAVMHYGTENRPAGSFIPPSTVRFDSICFKGEPIADLLSESSLQASLPDLKRIPLQAQTSSLWM